MLAVIKVLMVWVWIRWKMVVIHLLWLRFAEREWKGRWGSGYVLCLEVVRYDPVDYVVCSCRVRS